MTHSFFTVLLSSVRDCSIPGVTPVCRKPVPPSLEHITHHTRALFHAIHSIFPPVSVTQHDGEDPISQKKLDEGEGVWLGNLKNIITGKGDEDESST